MLNADPNTDPNNRLHRRGQGEPVQVFYLVTEPGSQEDQAWQRMRRLLRDNTAVVNSAAQAEELDVHAVQELGQRAARPMVVMAPRPQEQECGGGGGGMEARAEEEVVVVDDEKAAVAAAAGEEDDEMRTALQSTQRNEVEGGGEEEAGAYLTALSEGGTQLDGEEAAEEEEAAAGTAAAAAEEEAAMDALGGCPALPPPLEVSEDLPDTLKTAPPPPSRRRRARQAAAAGASPQLQEEERAAVEAAVAATKGAGQEVVEDVWFELSRYTGWLHLHAARDGSRSLGAHIDPYDLFELANLCAAALHEGEGGSAGLAKARARAAKEVKARALSPRFFLHPRAKWAAVRAVADLRLLSPHKRTTLYGRCFAPPLDLGLAGKRSAVSMFPAAVPALEGSFRRHVALEELLDGTRHSAVTRKARYDVVLDVDGSFVAYFQSPHALTQPRNHQPPPKIHNDDRCWSPTAGGGARSSWRSTSPSPPTSPRTARRSRSACAAAAPAPSAVRCRRFRIRMHPFRSTPPSPRTHAIHPTQLTRGVVNVKPLPHPPPFFKARSGTLGTSSAPPTA